MRLDKSYQAIVDVTECLPKSIIHENPNLHMYNDVNLRRVREVPNQMQKCIYNLSAGAPILIAFAIIWYCEKKTLAVSITCVCTAVLLIALMVIAFAYGKRSLPPILINVEDVSPHDIWIAAYIISYLLPFASMALDDFNLPLLFVVYFALVLVVSFVNSPIPNLILIFGGYHFYKITSENGVSGYVLISKRKIRNAKDLKSVYRVFEFLLEDVEGM